MDSVGNRKFRSIRLFSVPAVPIRDDRTEHLASIFDRARNPGVLFRSVADSVSIANVHRCTSPNSWGRRHQCDECPNFLCSGD